MRKCVVAVIVGGILFAFGGDGESAAPKLSVFVSILPQKYFVEKIGGDRVAVSVMVMPGMNPATYEPKPRQMAELSVASVYFALGVPFESVWMERIAATNPRMHIVHTDKGIRKRPMETVRAHDDAPEHGHNAHGTSRSHHHDGMDPHIWLSPPLVKMQARHVLSALTAFDSARKNYYETNFKLFESEIDRLDKEIRSIFKDRSGLQFMVFHPSWGYFADTYGLKQIPIEIEGKSPKPAQLKQLILHAVSEKISVIFVQPQFSTKSAEIIARAIGGKVVPADPLALDWAENLMRQASLFKAALN